jgi:hypothetical protein
MMPKNKNNSKMWVLKIDHFTNKNDLGGRKCRIWPCLINQHKLLQFLLGMQMESREVGAMGGTCYDQKNKHKLLAAFVWIC